MITANWLRRNGDVSVSDERGVPLLSESGTRLEAAVRTHSIGIFETDPHSGVVYWNGELQQIFGYEVGTFPGTLASWRRHLLPDDATRLARVFQDAIDAKRESIFFSYQMCRCDGQIRFIEASAQLYYDEAGNHTRRIGVNVDVTDRVAEQARWRSLFEQMHEGFIACELEQDETGTPIDFRFLELNEPAERLSGMSRQSALGRGAYEVLPTLEKFWLRTYARVVQTGEPANFTHFAAPLKRWFNVHAYRYAEKRFAVLFLDVTEQKRLEAAAKEAQRTLLRTTRLNVMGAMASTLAHELNQPLGAAANYLGAVERILSSKAEPELNVAREAAALATTAHLRAGEIIRRMKSFALEGRLDTRPECLSDIIASSANEALAESVASGLLVELDVGGDLTLRADKVQLTQVFTNLFRNAVSAMEGQEGPRRLAVKARVSGASIDIRVTDNGRGIPPDELDRIFHAFHSTTGGMGLGLAMCKTIIDAHGGDIKAELPIGPGSVFTIRLPLGLAGNPPSGPRRP